MTKRGAILGLGRRGEAWAGLCLEAGWDLRAFDPAPSAASAEARLPGLHREETISAAVQKADWVFCCVPDRLELIQMVLQRAQAEAPDGAVLAVASAALDIEALQSCAIRPGQVLRLGVRDQGSIALDFTERNPADLRAAAEGVVAELESRGSFRGSSLNGNHDAGAESA